MIRAVTFDFWNTLYVEDADALTRRRDRRTALTQSFFAAAGKVLPSAEVRVALGGAIETISAMRVEEHRNPSHSEIGQLIAAELGLRLEDADAEVLAETLSSAGRDYPPAPADGAGVLLTTLRSKVAMGVISDTGMTLGMHLTDVMTAHGLGEFFTQCTWSDQTLTTKPSSRQFLFTLHMLKAQPGEAVHVGDLEAADVAGAQAVGMKTIRLGGSDALTAADATAGSLVEVAEVLRRWGVGV